MASSGKRFVSSMVSGMLSPMKGRGKNQNKQKSEDEGFVEVSEVDAFIDSDYESGDHGPPNNKDPAMVRSFDIDNDSDEDISFYDGQIYSSKTHFLRGEEITSDDDLDPEDTDVDPPMPTDHFKGLFAKFENTTKIDEGFEQINAEEAEEAKGAENGGRAARLNAAMELVRRKHELRMADPSPEQLRCPCLFDEKNGWKKCPSAAHKELGKLNNTN